MLFTEVGKCWIRIGFKGMEEEIKCFFVSDMFHLESLFSILEEIGEDS